MSGIPGTFAGYDVVLSISQEAINKQIKLLYDHQIPGAIRPVGARVKGGLPAAPAKYAINHEWHICCETYTDDDGNEVVQSDVGIFAHLECPKIILDGQDGNSATISITFRKDPSIIDDPDPEKHQSSDSRFYYRGGNPSHPTLKFEVINGWTVSWQVKIKQANIEHDMKTLANRAQDPNDPVYVPPGLQEKFKTIDPRAFTVASIFCLFESAKFVNTFSIKTASGGQPQRQILVTMLDHINAYFKGLAAAAAEDNKPITGVSTPDVPFVLGYGLTQSIQNLRDINPTASWDATPAYFVPWRFDLTTTRGGNEDRNTLNYCILTHETKDPNNDHPRDIDVTKDLNAGNLGQSLFDVTRANYGDAVMAWGREIFWDKFIRENIIPACFVDPKAVVADVMSARGLNNFNKDSSWEKYQDDRVRDSPGSYCRNVDFRTKHFDLDRDSNWNHGAEICVDGYSKTVVTMRSDLLDAQSNSLSADHARRVYLKCETYYHMMAEVNTYAHVINPPHYRAYQGAVTLRYCNNLVIEAGNGGTWQVSSASDSHLPAFDEFTIPGFLLNSKPATFKLLKFQDLGDNSPKDGEWGAFSENHEFNSAHIFSDPDIQNQLKGSASLATGSAMVALAAKLGATMNALKTSIMMPGGEVFTFNGMDTDGDANLYAHVTYALGAEGARQT